MILSVSDFTNHCLLGPDDGRAVCQLDGDLRGGETCSNAHVPEPVHSEFSHFRHDTVPGVHAVHADVDIATPMDHGHSFLQTRATPAGHQHNGVGGHDHGDSHRPVLGDRPRVRRSKRTPYRVRVHCRRVVVGSHDDVSCSLLPG